LPGSSCFDFNAEKFNMYKPQRAGLQSVFFLEASRLTERFAIMTSHGSITQWIDQLRAGEQAAAQQLWEHYSRRLASLARTKLRGERLGAADEEDVVQSAFLSFFRGVERGQFPQLADRTNLWPLLVLITKRKALDLRERNHREKRGGGAVRGESALAGAAGSEADGGGWNQVLGSDPTPEDLAKAAEETARLLERLADQELRSIALWKLQGYTNKEIAAKLGRSLATAERKLERIRALWEEEVAP
jgi:RNA polymerase sigma factor (sigma-70 family)